jgi:hypothetical protein
LIVHGPDFHSAPRFTRTRGDAVSRSEIAVASSSVCGCSCAGAWLILITSTLFQFAASDQSTLPYAP